MESLWRAFCLKHPLTNMASSQILPRQAPETKPMATPDSPVFPPKLLHIDAFQSVLPGRVAEPGQSRRIAIPGDGLCGDALQSHFRMVLYYNKQKAAQQQQDVIHDEESPWTLAAWMKESLSAALPDHPVLCGRLRRAGGEGGGDGCLEIKFNDAGVRLVQATADVTMAEFLASEKKDEMEGHLAYWLAIDEKHPNFSPLFYFQVTQFQGGGYSIGISCSLLLADPLFLTRFLKSWAKTHVDMLAQGRLSNPPMFHLGYFQSSKRLMHLKSIKLSSAATVAGTTALFKHASPASYDALASGHVREATMSSLTSKHSTSTNFTVMVSDHSRELRVLEPSPASEYSNTDAGSFDVARWDELGMQDLALAEGNKPVQVSYGVVHPGKEGGGGGGLVVLMIPSDVEGNPNVLVSVTVP